MFITGTLNTFAKYTNVDTQDRIIDYDIRELGEQLMPLGMLVTLDAIYNRVIQNQKRGKRTWIVADEFYILFRYEYSANFFYKLWKRIRKYNGLITGLTQNVDELLRSDTARLMYDAAHTFGETYNGQGVGNFGDASCFSFHATKAKK